MKTPEVDYRKVRLSNIKSSEYRHLLLLLGWVWYLIMYVITERLIPESKCHVVHSKVDDIIPFNEYFILVYISWYVLIVLTLLYFLLYDVKSFIDVQIFIIATQVIAIITYIVWPSIQNLRPQTFADKNFCTFIVGLIYKADTPTGVCPSLHVAYSLAMLSVWLKRKNGNRLWKAVVTIWVVLVCMSVCFAKQHSFTDVWAAALMCLIIEIVLFGKKYYIAKIKDSRIAKIKDNR